MLQVLQTWSSRMLAQKPGDPLADLIFFIAFCQYQQELQQALLDEGLLIHLPRPGPFLLERHDGTVESMPFGMPAFFDDFFVPLVNDSLAGLFGRHSEDCRLLDLGWPQVWYDRPPSSPASLAGPFGVASRSAHWISQFLQASGVKAAPTVQSQRAQESPAQRCFGKV